MPRRIDTPGEITDASGKVADQGGLLPPLLIEFPLWRAGRMRFSSSSQKASLALAAVGVLVALMAALALIEALPGQHPGVETALEKISQALILVLGVLLGVEWGVERSPD